MHLYIFHLLSEIWDIFISECIRHQWLLSWIIHDEHDNPLEFQAKSGVLTLDSRVPFASFNRLFNQMGKWVWFSVHCYAPGCRHQPTPAKDVRPLDDDQCSREQHQQRCRGHEVRHPLLPGVWRQRRVHHRPREIISSSHPCSLQTKIRKNRGRWSTSWLYPCEKRFLFSSQKKSKILNIL